LTLHAPCTAELLRKKKSQEKEKVVNAALEHKTSPGSEKEPKNPSDERTA
jgi:hypothetical protein